LSLMLTIGELFTISSTRNWSRAKSLQNREYPIVKLSLVS
jgi:hypothetical protein